MRRQLYRESRSQSEKSSGLAYFKTCNRGRLTLNAAISDSMRSTSFPLLCAVAFFLLRPSFCLSNPFDTLNACPILVMPSLSLCWMRRCLMFGVSSTSSRFRFGILADLVAGIVNGKSRQVVAFEMKCKKGFPEFVATTFVTLPVVSSAHGTCRRPKGQSSRGASDCISQSAREPRTEITKHVQSV